MKKCGLISWCRQFVIRLRMTQTFIKFQYLSTYFGLPSLMFAWVWLGCNLLLAGSLRSIHRLQTDLVERPRLATISFQFSVCRPASCKLDMWAGFFSSLQTSQAPWSTLRAAYVSCGRQTPRLCLRARIPVSRSCRCYQSEKQTLAMQQLRGAQSFSSSLSSSMYVPIWSRVTSHRQIVALLFSPLPHWFYASLLRSISLLLYALFLRNIWYYDAHHIFFWWTG